MSEVRVKDIEGRPIITEMKVLEKMIVGLEGEIQTLRAKAAIYLVDVQEEQDKGVALEEFTPSALLIDSIRLFTGRIERIKKSVVDLIDRLA